MNLYELVTSEEYRKRAGDIAGSLTRINDNFLKIKKFAMEERGWHEREATMLAGQMTGCVRTQFP